MSPNFALFQPKAWMNRLFHREIRPRHYYDARSFHVYLTHVNTYPVPTVNPNLVAITQEATVRRVLVPGLEWQIGFQGSFWKARSIFPNVDFMPGSRVYVVGRQNLILLIQPMADELPATHGTYTSRYI
jgi:hypothetical protein